MSTVIHAHYNYEIIRPKMSVNLSIIYSLYEHYYIIQLNINNTCVPVILTSGQVLLSVASLMNILRDCRVLVPLRTTLTRSSHSPLISSHAKPTMVVSTGGAACEPVINTVVPGRGQKSACDPVIIKRVAILE